MTKTLKFFKGDGFILLSIILLAVFLRLYKASDWFDFYHDGDLYSWFVKEIVVNHNIRLIGQETTVQGVFIGPFFYYSIIPFFVLNNMSPLSLVWYGVLIGIATIGSFYFVFKNLFGRLYGLIAACLQAVLMVRVGYDRWIVATITSHIWEIWYLYVLFKILKGEGRYYFFAGVLLALIWHINFSLAPAVLGLIAAVILSRKFLGKSILQGIGGFILTSSPFILFEVRNGFIQTKTLINQLMPGGGAAGNFGQKLSRIIDQVSGNVYQMFFYPSRGEPVNNLLLIAVFGVIAGFLVYKKVLNRNQLLVLIAWLIGVVGFFVLSSRISSEYYFTNLDLLFLSLAVLFFGWISMKLKWGKILVILILIGYSVLSVYNLIYKTHYNQLGFNERYAVARYIKLDSLSKGHKCVSVSFITNPGNDLGYRYVFYLVNLHLNWQGEGIPNYTIVVKDRISDYPISTNFGAIGVINPKEDDYDNKRCREENINISEPMLGFY